MDHNNTPDNVQDKNHNKQEEKLPSTIVNKNFPTKPLIIKDFSKDTKSSKNLDVLDDEKKLSEEYYNCVKTSLNTATYVIARDGDCTKLTSNMFNNRSGSTLFEEELKSLIRTHHETIIKETNNTLENFMEKGIIREGWKTIQLEATLNDDEAAQRTPEDVTLHLKHPNDSTDNPHKEFINVKASKGNSADNVGGWAALGCACYGSSARIDNRRKFEKYFAENPIPSTPSDYFLWVFDKNKSYNELILSGGVFSILKTNRAAFAFNPAQPFPLQFNHSKAANLPDIEGDAIELKKDAINYIFSNLITAYEANILRSRGVLQTLKERPNSL